jgi:hypothetical protein
MKRFLLLVTSILLAGTALAYECSNEDFASFCETKAAVERVLSYPAYTGWDEKVLSRAGDMAALAQQRKDGPPERRAYSSQLTCLGCGVGALRRHAIAHASTRDDRNRSRSVEGSGVLTRGLTA